jgi:hypothetical protein
MTRTDHDLGRPAVSVATDQCLIPVVQEKDLLQLYLRWRAVIATVLRATASLPKSAGMQPDPPHQSWPTGTLRLGPMVTCVPAVSQSGRDDD